MKTFKQFLLEDPQRGKTIIFYHRTGLGGQSRSHVRLKKDNPEDHVDSFLDTGFVIGEGDLYGKGVYGFYTEKSMLDREGGGYGDIVLKIKVNTDKILITVPEVAKSVYNRPITLEEQFEMLKLKYKSEDMMEWERQYNNNENVGLSIVGHYGKVKIPKLIKGLVYKGQQDLGAMVVYDKKLLTIMSYNTTIKDKTKLDGPWINVLNKNKKQIKTALTQRLSSFYNSDLMKNPLDLERSLKLYKKYSNTTGKNQKRKFDERFVDVVSNYPYLIQNIMDADIDPSEAVQLAAVKADANMIQYIINGGYDPSPAVQLAAVKKNGNVIRYIIKAKYELSEELQLAAVKYSGEIIQDIINAKIKPSPEVQLAAVKNYEDAIQFIINAGYKQLPEELQLAAVEKNGLLIRNIIQAGYELSEAVQLAAVKQDGRVIDIIMDAGYDPSPEVQLAAVKQNPQMIVSISGYELSEAIQLAAVEKNGDMIRHIENPTPNVIDIALNKGVYIVHEDAYKKLKNQQKEKLEQNQIAAVKKYDGFVNPIFYIVNSGFEPSEAVQLAAIEDTLSSIAYIKNPTPNVIQYVIDNYPKKDVEKILSQIKYQKTQEKLQKAFDEKYK